MYVTAKKPHESAVVSVLSDIGTPVADLTADVLRELLDLCLLIRNDRLHEITNRYQALDFVIFDDGQMANSL